MTKIILLTCGSIYAIILGVFIAVFVISIFVYLIDAVKEWKE